MTIFFAIETLDVLTGGFLRGSAGYLGGHSFFAVRLYRRFLARIDYLSGLAVQRVLGIIRVTARISAVAVAIV